MKERKIIHVDMDAFFASVEQRDRPELKGQPVIVGGDPKKRGVVATCSYEARRFGIHSAMSSKEAYQRCPFAIFLKPRIEVYQAISDQIKTIFLEYSDLVEMLSLDEAYLDVTENKKNLPYATLVANEIKQEIFKKLNLTASAGVSFNKFLAKIASGMHKPDGLTVIPPKYAEKFMETLSIDKFYGIGPATEKLLKANGIYTGLDLKIRSKEELQQLLGKRGDYYYDIVRSKEDTIVNPVHIRKSIGREITLEKDISTLEEKRIVLAQLAEDLFDPSYRAKTLTLKVTFATFEKITRSVTLNQPISSKEEMLFLANRLLAKPAFEPNCDNFLDDQSRRKSAYPEGCRRFATESDSYEKVRNLTGMRFRKKSNKFELENKKIRLLGLSLSNFQKEKLEEQLKLPIQLA